jgi:hypothetical protein
MTQAILGEVKARALQEDEAAQRGIRLTLFGKGGSVAVAYRLLSLLLE